MEIEVADLVSTLWAASCPDKLQRAAFRLAMLCHSSKPTHHMQNIALEAGCIDACAHVVCHGDRGVVTPPALMRVMACMRQVCFKNDRACVAVANTKVLEECASIIRDPSSPTHLQYEALDVPCAVAYGFEAHARVAATFVDIARDVLSDPARNVHLSQVCVTLLNNLAYNPANHALLEHSNIVPHLHAVYLSRDPRIFYFDAAIALANIQPTHASLDGDGELMGRMVEALRRTWGGCDYPPASGWYYTLHKLLFGISNMCTSQANCAILRDNHAVALLSEILADNTQPLAVQNALRVVWKLMSQEVQVH